MPVYDLIGNLNKEATQLLVKANTDKLDVALSTRAADRTTAAAPFSVRLSDGSAFLSSLPVTQSGTWSVGRTWTLSSGTDSIAVSGTVAATQSGTWTTGRTWSLSSGTDSITAIQGTSPWVVSGTLSTVPSGTQDVNITQVNGTSQTAANWSTYFANLDVALSTRLKPADTLAAVTSITNPVSVTQGTSPWVVSGTVAATQSGAWTTGRTWNLSSGSDSVNVGNFPATYSVTQGTSPWVVDGSGVTQPVSVASLPLPTGASTSAKQPNIVGTWGYNAGTSGTLTLSGSKRLLQISAIAEEAAATITINGGDTITLPYGSTDKVSSVITIEPKGNLVDPTIVFTSTKAYFVEYTT